MLSKRLKYIRRKTRTRFKLKNNNIYNNRIRLSFNSSNKYLYSQIIDDNRNLTLYSMTTHSKHFKDLKNKNNIKAASMLGDAMANCLLEKKIASICFDRGAYQYHGKARAFAENVRKKGFNF